jgi:hypothetical protein
MADTASSPSTLFPPEGRSLLGVYSARSARSINRIVKMVGIRRLPYDPFLVMVCPRPIPGGLCVLVRSVSTRLKRILWKKYAYCEQLLVSLV